MNESKKIKKVMESAEFLSEDEPNIINDRVRLTRFTSLMRIDSMVTELEKFRQRVLTESGSDDHTYRVLKNMLDKMEVQASKLSV